ncbi:MAG: hypothetical protein QXG65_01735 [Thermoplasmata archaeon]
MNDRPRTAVDPEGPRPRPPPWLERIGVGGLVFLGTYLLLVAVPNFLAGVVAGSGVSLPFSTGGIQTAGILLAVLAAAQSIARPTIAYGPISLIVDLLAITYLWLLYLASPLHITLATAGGASAGGTGLAVGITTVVLVLIGIELLHLAGNAALTAHDLRRPGERLWWTYPVR